MVISAYTRRMENRKPVTKAFSYLKDRTYKEESKNTAQGKGVKLPSSAQDRQCGINIVPASCESRYHIYNDYRHKDLSVIKSEKSEKGAGLLEKIITATGEPLIRKKTVYYGCKLKKLLSGCLTYTAYHKNRTQTTPDQQQQDRNRLSVCFVRFIGRRVPVRRGFMTLNRTQKNNIKRKKENNMKNKKIYFAETNGYNMIISVDSENNCRYLTETNDFPDISGIDSEQKKQAATEFLECVEDDSSWEDDCTYDQIFVEDVEVLAEIWKEL